MLIVLRGTSEMKVNKLRNKLEELQALIHAQSATMLQAKDRLQSRITSISIEIAEKLDKITVLDNELSAIRSGTIQITGDASVSVPALRTPLAVDKVSQEAARDLQEICKEMKVKLAIAMARIDKEEAAQRKKLLVSMF